MKLDSGMTIGQRIKYLRNQQDMTLSQLCTLSGISKEHICIMEHDGYNDMWVSTLKKLAAALDCELIIRLRPRYRQVSGAKHDFNQCVPRLSHRPIPDGQ